MKKLFNVQMVGSILLLLTIFLSSCKQDLNVVSPTSDEQIVSEKIDALDMQGVKVENGMLHFENLEALNKATELLKKSNFASLQAWSQSQNFKSLAILKDEFNTQLSKATTEEEIKELAFRNSDIFELLPDSSFRINNPYANLFPFLNRESMLMIGNALCKYDKNGAIIVFDGNLDKMRNAVITKITEKEQGVVVISNQNSRLQTRAACTKGNDSGMQYGDSGRRAKVIFSQFWLPTPNPSGFTFTFRSIINVQTFAQKRTLRVYFDYSTEQTLRFQSNLFVPTPIRGSTSSQPFFFDETLIGVQQSLSFIRTVREWVNVQNYEALLNVESRFLDIDYFYSNRGGVNFEFHCSNP